MAKRMSVFRKNFGGCVKNFALPAFGQFFECLTHAYSQCPSEENNTQKPTECNNEDSLVAVGYFSGGGAMQRTPYEI